MLLSLCFKHKPGGYNKKLIEMYWAVSKGTNRVRAITAAPLPLKTEGTT